MWGIWDFDKNDWVRPCLLHGNPILAFESKRAACLHASRNYGFETYSEAKRRGWCEVLLLVAKHPRGVVRDRRRACGKLGPEASLGDTCTNH